MIADMLVKLYDLDPEIKEVDELKDRGITFKRAHPADKHRILEYIRNTFHEAWASECDIAFSNSPVSCFIAVQDKKVVGFACYEATAKGYFGPMGVTETLRGEGVGKVLLLKCLLAMQEEGYGYAIIGGVDHALGFYKKTVNATAIEDSHPGIYSRMIHQ